jgi:hypothetical protein
LSALLGVLLLATACSGDDASPTVQDDGATILEPGLDAPMAIAGLTWTSAVSDDTGEPVDSVESFTTISPSVIAVVEATDVPAGTQFTATWSIDGIDVPEATMDVTVEQDMTEAWIAFEFIRDEGRYFPLGELEVVVTASTGESIDATVDIQLP